MATDDSCDESNNTNSEDYELRRALMVALQTLTTQHQALQNDYEVVCDQRDRLKAMTETLQMENDELRQSVREARSFLEEVQRHQSVTHTMTTFDDRLHYGIPTMTVSPARSTAHCCYPHPFRVANTSVSARPRFSPSLWRRSQSSARAHPHSSNLEQQTFDHTFNDPPKTARAYRELCLKSRKDHFQERGESVRSEQSKNISVFSNNAQSLTHKSISLAQSLGDSPAVKIRPSHTDACRNVFPQMDVIPSLQNRKSKSAYTKSHAVQLDTYASALRSSMTSNVAHGGGGSQRRASISAPSRFIGSMTLPFYRNTRSTHREFTSHEGR